MPTYDYECKKCGRFDIFQKITEPPLEICPECGGSVNRLISKNVAIIFKGSGFYSTDNKQKDIARKIDKERQADGQALADGDMASFVGGAKKADAKIAEG